jgi:hypothetical protein
VRRALQEWFCAVLPVAIAAMAHAALDLSGTAGHSQVALGPCDMGSLAPVDTSRGRCTIRAGAHVPTALRQARAQVRRQATRLAGDAAPDAAGPVIVGLDGVLVLALAGSRTRPRPGRRRSGTIHPPMGSADHGRDVQGASDRTAAPRERGQQHRPRPRRSRPTRPETAAEEVPTGATDAAPHRLGRGHPRVRRPALRPQSMVVVLGRHDLHRRCARRCSAGSRSGLAAGCRARRRDAVGRRAARSRRW